MSTSATEGVSAGFMAAFNASAGPGAAGAGSSMDKDTFLQLLVAQLRYQDPLKPTDSAQFLAQSAQFTALEKMEEVASQTAQALAAQMAFGASSLVGRTVSFSQPDGTTTSGTVDAVRFGSDGPMLDVGGEEVAMSSVLSVSDGATADSTTGSSSGTA